MSLGVLKGLFERLREPSSATPATPGTRGGVAAKPAPVLGCTPATPATPEIPKVETQSASDPKQDIDRWCWPNDPGPDAAMNSAEIALFVGRHVRLLALGLRDCEAERLAETLTRRDREHDDRHSCAECRQGRARRCADGVPPIADCCIVVHIARP
ncbi:hypothetical protein ACIPRI_12605 [Variovorax sp. LARHSF232]